MVFLYKIYTFNQTYYLKKKIVKCKCRCGFIVRYSGVKYKKQNNTKIDTKRKRISLVRKSFFLIYLSPRSRRRRHHHHHNRCRLIRACVISGGKYLLEIYISSSSFFFLKNKQTIAHAHGYYQFKKGEIA